MRGIAGRQTRGLPTMARLHVADNTGEDRPNRQRHRSVVPCVDTLLVASVT